jgi:hypothetical protein
MSTTLTLWVQKIILDNHLPAFVSEPNMDKIRTRDGSNCIDKSCTCKEVFLKKVDSRTIPNRFTCLSLPLLDKAY